MTWVNHEDLDANNDDLQYAESFSSHILNVAGVASARSKNDKGMMGMAVNAKLSYYAFGPIDQQTQGETAALYIADAVNNGADVINFSWGGNDVPAVKAAVLNAHNSGVVMIASSGNGGTYVEDRYPASYAEVIGVTASGKNGQRHHTANYGPLVDIAAPGEDIIVTHDFDDDDDSFPASEYGAASGTSVSAPHVAGVAALVIGANSNLSKSSIEHILLSNAVNPQGDNTLGEGIVQAFGSVVDALMQKTGTHVVLSSATFEDETILNTTIHVPEGSNIFFEGDVILDNSTVYMAGYMAGAGTLCYQNGSNIHSIWDGLSEYGGELRTDGQCEEPGGGGGGGGGSGEEPEYDYVITSSSTIADDAISSQLAHICR